MSRPRLWPAAWAAVMLASCGETRPGPDRMPGPASRPTSSAPTRQLEAVDEPVPAAMQPCFGCHYSIVRSYLEHGMSHSLGPLGNPPEGKITNPASGALYELSTDQGGSWLMARFADGGRRRQRIVGRIGAGIFDTSWVTAETDVLSGKNTRRLFFAPVESITGRGLELSPFELRERSAGLDLALTEGCLTCHTTDRLDRLPGAATAGGASGRDTVFPPNALGADAFDRLSPIGCHGCHGQTSRHLAAVAQLAEGRDTDDLGIVQLGRLDAGRQRDVCARCHLQGEARLDLAAGEPDVELPLAGQIPVLVAARPTDDFRFVGQLERLALSACFKGSPEMTCTTCHMPHSGVAKQGVGRLQAACLDCHKVCSRPPSLKVVEVTGEAARTKEGCLDCHLRRSQPFDLPHVRSADHYIRRHIPTPEAGIPHRQFTDPSGALELYDDGRLAQELATPSGGLWTQGVLAMGLATMGRLAEALQRFDEFPAPGTAAARRPTAPPGLKALETDASFHETRALVLLASGRFTEAQSAFSDALEIDPMAASALLGRAQLRFNAGDVAGALEDTQRVIEAFPQAEQPWALRARMAERLGRPDLARAAFVAYTKAWPSNAGAWYKLALLLRQQGMQEETRQALAKARTLSPSPPPGLVVEGNR